MYKFKVKNLQNCINDYQELKGSPLKITFLFNFFYLEKGKSEAEKTNRSLWKGQELSMNLEWYCCPPAGFRLRKRLYSVSHLPWLTEKSNSSCAHKDLHGNAHLPDGDHTQQDQQE
jgi:hypothetical protein